MKTMKTMKTMKMKKTKRRSQSLLCFAACTAAMLLLLSLPSSAAGLRGDFDGNGTLNSADAVYLLRHALLGDSYAVAQDPDVNGDGTLNSADANYLLRSILFGEADYPLADDSWNESKPFCVVPAGEEARYFDTLEEALAEAEHYPCRGMTPDGVEYDYYENVIVVGKAEVGDLTIGTGTAVIVDEGGALTVKGRLTLGKSTVAGSAVNAGTLSARGGALTVGDTVFTGEDGLFTVGEDSVLALCGLPAEFPEDSAPDLYLSGRFTLEKDLRADASLCRRLVIEYGAELLLKADLDLILSEDFYPALYGTVFLNHDEAEGGLGKLSTNSTRSVGYTDDCSIQMTGEDGMIFTSNDRYENGVVFMGGDTRINRSISFSGLLLRPYDGENSAISTLTIPSGVDAEINGLELGGNLLIEEGGTLTLYGDCEVKTRFAVDNRGTLNIAETLVLNGASLINREGAEIFCDGGLMLYTPNGLYRVIGDNVFTQAVSGDSSFDNRGVIRVSDFGSLQIDCDQAVNSGEIVSDGFVLMSEWVTFDRYIACESVTCPDSEIDWEHFLGWDVSGGEPEKGYVRYFRKLDEWVENVCPIDGSFVNRGSLINRGTLLIDGVTFGNEAEGTLETLGNTSFYCSSIEEHYGFNADIPLDALRGIEFPEAVLLNRGALRIGNEENSFASLSVRDARLENFGEILLFGSASFERADYSQDASASFIGEEGSFIGFYGGSVTVPSGAVFETKGELHFDDIYGNGYSPNDISGFDDLFTCWNTGDEGNFCTFVTEIFDNDGFSAAIAAQNGRPENFAYNGFYVFGDLTFEEDTVLPAFCNIEIHPGTETVWSRYDPETDTVVPAEPGEEGAFSSEIAVPTTLTVPRGVTLTIPAECVLTVVGYQEFYDDVEEIISAMLKIDGTLIIEGNVEPSEENGFCEKDGGILVVLEFGSFDASEGSVVNNGTILVDYSESGAWTPDEYGWSYQYDGETLLRHQSCKTEGLPDNTTHCVHVTTQRGFENAVSGAYPINEVNVHYGDYSLTSLSPAVRYVSIDDYSSLTLENGVKLPEALTIANSGTLIIDDPLTVDGFLEIREGEVFGCPGKLCLNSKLIVRGHLMVGGIDIEYGENGSIQIEDGGRIEAFLPEYEFLPVTLAEEAVPCWAQGVRFDSDLILHANREQNYFFDRCFFGGNIILIYEDGSPEFIVDFNDTCTFAEGCSVIVLENGVDDYSRINDSILILGPNGLNIESKAPVRAASSIGSFTLNGITVDCIDRSEWDCWFSASMRFDELFDEYGEYCGNYPVFQIDCAQGTTAKLTGELYCAEELRLQQGGIDISELEIPDFVRVNINDEFGHTYVNVGTHTVYVWDGGDDRFFGYEISAEEGAVINVCGAQMIWNDDEKRYEGTPLTLLTDGKDYYLDPHVFGTVYGEPGVYIGLTLGSDDVSYTLEKDGNALSFSEEIITTGGEHKTHLNRTGSGEWFTSGDGVTLTVAFSGGPTVIFDPVPIKPEWEENY